MIIEKDKLKSIITEELNRLSEKSDEGTEMADEAIQKFSSLNENQKLNFLEKFFSYLKENNDI